MPAMRVAMVLVALAVMSIGCSSSTTSTKFKMAGRLITLHTLPEGARVYQLAPMSGERVDLGMTPLINQPVVVMTQAGVHGVSPAEVSRLMTQMNAARLHIEKAGYQPWDGSIYTDPKQAVERTIALERIASAPG